MEKRSISFKAGGQKAFGLFEMNMNLVLKKDLFPAGFESAHSHVTVLSATPRLPGIDEIKANFDKI